MPVVGAGTSNTEFEILTGMAIQYFGLGEYPYKTVLKSTPCESIASDLSQIGYATHALHNNGGNFYSRAKVFSNMEPTMLYYDPEESGVTITIGKDACYYHPDVKNVMWNEEVQPYGYAGVRHLCERLLEV